MQRDSSLTPNAHQCNPKEHSFRLKVPQAIPFVLTAYSIVEESRSLAPIRRQERIQRSDQALVLPSDCLG